MDWNHGSNSWFGPRPAPVEPMDWEDIPPDSRNAVVEPMDWEDIPQEPQLTWGTMPGVNTVAIWPTQSQLQDWPSKNITPIPNFKSNTSNFSFLSNPNYSSPFQPFHYKEKSLKHFSPAAAAKTSASSALSYKKTHNSTFLEYVEVQCLSARWEKTAGRWGPILRNVNRLKRRELRVVEGQRTELGVQCVSGHYSLA
ncbi:hypothetical protein WDU94_008847 [Cyamophila willieti]